MEKIESDGILRVAVNFKHGMQLKKLDFSRPMEEVVRILCEEENIPYEPGKLALWSDTYLNNETKWVSDENKHRVQPASFLNFKESPTTLVAGLMKQISEQGITSLKVIAVESKDTVVADTLHAFGAHQKVYDLLDENWEPSVWVTCGLIFINRLYFRRVIRRVPGKIITRIFQTLSVAFKLNMHEDFFIHCLKLLSSVRRFGRLYYNNELFDHLSILLLNRNHPALQEASLELLNYLVIFPNHVEDENNAMARVVNQKIVGAICDNILLGEYSKGMQQQLYRYQTLILRPYWRRKVTKVDNTDRAVKELRKLICRAKRGKQTNTRRRLFSDEVPPKESPLKRRTGLLSSLRSSFRRSRSMAPNSPPGSPTSTRSKSPTKRSLRRTKAFYSCALNNTQQITPPLDEEFRFDFYGPIELSQLPSDKNHLNGSGLKKSASTSEIEHLPKKSYYDREEETANRDPALSTKVVSELTVKNLCYLAEHHEQNFLKWAINKHQSYKFAEQISHVVCRVLEVGRPRPMDNPGDSLHPLVFFTYPHVVEELFCEAMALFERTSKEMKARGSRDELKVMATIQEQLLCGLNPLSPDKSIRAEKPMSLNHLRDKLEFINYAFIAAKRQTEVNERITYELRSKPVFLAYRESQHDSVLNLIKQQRLNFIKEGQHMPRFNSRGELQKNVQDFLALSDKGRHLIVGDCHFPPERCQHSRRISIDDIVDVSFGKQSHFYWEVFNHNENKMLKANQSDNELYACFFSLKTIDAVHHFCAPNIESLYYWSDALNILLGKPMNSPAMTEEMQSFLDLEVRLHFLDVEGLPIPDEAPALPPPPPNYDFLLKEKKRTRPDSFRNVYKRVGVSAV